MNNATQQQIKFAHELADSFNDREAYPFYLSCVQKYQEEFLRKLHQKVLSIPEEKIKKTRGALFTYLVNQHGGSQSAWN